MAPITFLRMYNITGDKKYLDYMNQEFKWTTDRLYSKEDSLFYRDARFIGKINEKYSCDENRHYIMGLSMGAYATWDLLARHTDMFAAAVAICGGADTSTAEKIKDIPIWAAHGTADSVVPCSGSQNMVQALKDAGSTSIHYTEYEGKPHAIWNIVAADPEILNWLFSQVRGTKQS